MTKVSVIIPTYNSWKTLKSCIASIQKQTLKPFEIIVIDNASPDKTKEGMQKLLSTNHKSSTVKYFRLRKNLGVTGGRNKGIREASRDADYLFFFDHDMVADKNMLAELVKTAEMDNSIGIVTPKIYYWKDKRSLRSGDRKKRIWSAGTGINLWTGQVFFRGGEDTGQYDKIEEVQVAPAAMLVKKEVIKKIKGFDNRYFATFEDTDFCFRAKRAGFKTYYTPKAIAYHKLSTDPKDEADRLLSRAYWVGRNRVIFMKDFGKSFAVFLLFLPIFSLYYLKMAIKHKRINDWLRFMKATFSGILS